MPPYNTGSIIALSIAVIVWIILTWKLIADKGWRKGIAVSVAGALGIVVMAFVAIFLIAGIGAVFGSAGTLVFIVLLFWWAWT